MQSKIWSYQGYDREKDSEGKDRGLVKTSRRKLATSLKLRRWKHARKDMKQFNKWEDIHGERGVCYIRREGEERKGGNVVIHEGA